MHAESSGAKRTASALSSVEGKPIVDAQESGSVRHGASGIGAAITEVTGKIVRSQHALVERDADPIFFAPNYVAGPLDLIACYKKREAVRNEQRGDYFERSTGFRDVPNDAVNPAAAELNRSSFQHAATWRDPVFVHGLLHARGG